MKCLVCKHFDVVPGTATVAIERSDLALLIKHVPARVCPNCGEEYVDEAAANRLLETAEQSARADVQVDVREYAAA